MAGRKPIPTALKVVRGNPGKRPLNENEPKPAVCTSLPEPPDYFDDFAKEAWYNTGQQLHECGLLTDIDHTAFELYCVSYSEWVRAQEMVKKSGFFMKAPSGYPVQSPAVNVANKAFEKMRKILVEFGMTPSSRSKVQVNKKEGSDEWEAFG